MVHIYILFCTLYLEIVPFRLPCVLYFFLYLASLLDCECRDFISFVSSHLYHAQALSLGELLGRQRSEGVKNEQRACWPSPLHREHARPRHAGPYSLLWGRVGCLPQIPPLGKHYSQRWAQEDLLEEQKDGARAAAMADKKKGLMGPLTELDTKGKPFTSLPTSGQDLSSQNLSPPVCLPLLCPPQMWMPC